MQAKILCLSALLQGPASGYEIKKTLEQPPFEHFQDAGFGSIYPALTKLASEGLVEVTEMAQEKRPDKKVYSISDEGRAYFLSTLTHPPAPDRYRSDFLFLLYHGEFLREDQLIALIDQRICDCDIKLTEMSSCAPTVDKRLKKWLLDLGIRHYDDERRALIELRADLLTAPEAPSPGGPVR